MQSSPIYTDFQSLAALRGVEGLGEAERLEDVAGQFASVFTQMMLKSMRDASLGEGILDSEQSLFYRDMFDQQLALELSDSGGVGIASMLSDYLRNVTGLPKPGSATTTGEAGGEPRLTMGRQAQAAYEQINNLGRISQEAPAAAQEAPAVAQEAPAAAQEAPAAAQEAPAAAQEAPAAAQEKAGTADKGDSRNELHGDDVNPVTLRWRGQTPR